MLGELWGYVISRVAAFIDLVIIEKRNDVLAIGLAARSLVTFQFLGRTIILIPPAAFEHEHVPDKHLFVVGPVSQGKAPGEDFVVHPDLQDALAHRGILDAQEAAASAIEGGAEVRVIISPQAAGGAKADLVKQPGVIHDATRAVVGAAWN